MKTFYLWEPPEPGPAELIPGLMLRHGGFLLFGQKELGKTTILFELAHSLLTGQPLWGTLVPAFTIPKALYVMGEHHQELAKAQWQMMFPGETGLEMVGVPPGANQIFRRVLLTQTIHHLTKVAEGAGLVIFDPLSAFMDGEGAENDPTTMRATVNAMIAIASPGLAAFGHHEGKPVYNPKMSAWMDSATPRGASSIVDAAAATWRLVRYRPGDLAQRYRLLRVGYKGIAPNWYELARDPRTLRHTLVRKYEASN